jgi:hypothetical protein
MPDEMLRRAAVAGMVEPGPVAAVPSAPIPPAPAPSFQIGGPTSGIPARAG